MMLTGVGVVLMALPVLGLTGNGRLLHHLLHRIRPVPVAQVAESPKAAALPAEPLRLCYTKAGFCSVETAPAGSPCGCASPLRGRELGYVIRADRSEPTRQSTWMVPPGER
jgi:hypothetical protein